MYICTFARATIVFVHSTLRIVDILLYSFLLTPELDADVKGEIPSSVHHHQLIHARIREVDVLDGQTPTGQNGHPGIGPATDHCAVVSPEEQSLRIAQVDAEADEEAPL